MDLFSGIGTAFKSVSGIIDEFKTTDEERVNAKSKLMAIESALTGRIMAYETQLAKSRRDILVAEAQSRSWIARNWRPILMLSITAILVHKYILYPYLSAMFTGVPTLEMPPELFTLLTVGVGGYVVGRSGEKIAKTIRETESTNAGLVSEERAARKDLKLRSNEMRRLSKIAKKEGWSEAELDERLRMLLGE